MIKNRMSLANLLVIIVLAFALFSGFMSLGASMENGNDAFYAMVTFGVICFLLVIIAYGISLKQGWARIAFLWVLYLGVAGWTVGAVYWVQEIFGNSYIKPVQKTFPFIFSISAYCILFGGIFFLQHEKVKEEFENDAKRKGEIQSQ